MKKNGGNVQGMDNLGQKREKPNMSKHVPNFIAGVSPADLDGEVERPGETRRFSNGTPLGWKTHRPREDCSRPLAHWRTSPESPTNSFVPGVSWYFLTGLQL